MYTEIEAKLKVDSLETIAAKLTELGAKFVDEQAQEDYYFDDSHSGLVKADKCLRLRRMTGTAGEKIFLTYKGPKEKSQVKKRQEIEVELDRADSAEKLLCAIGYEKKLIVKKNRRLWRLGTCEVALDDVALLGEFVEIEGPGDEAISDVQKRLGLADLLHIPQSYASLIAEKSG